MWDKYNKAKIKHFSVGLNADNESEDEKLQLRDEVDVVDRCLYEPATVPSSYARYSIASFKWHRCSIT